MSIKPTVSLSPIISLPLIQTAPQTGTRSVFTKSAAPSMVSQVQGNRETLHKQKVLGALRKLDSKQSGVINSNVFYNMLACLEIGLSERDEDELKAKFGVNDGIRYEEAMRSFTFDSVREEWSLI